MPGTIFVMPVVLFLFPTFLPTFLQTDLLYGMQLKAFKKRRLKLAPRALAQIQEHISLDRALPAQRARLLDSIAHPASQETEWIFHHNYVTKHVNIVNLPSNVRSLMLQFLGIPFSSFYSTARLLQWADWIVKDDQVIIYIIVVDFEPDRC